MTAKNQVLINVDCIGILQVIQKVELKYKGFRALD